MKIFIINVFLLQLLFVFSENSDDVDKLLSNISPNDTCIVNKTGKRGVIKALQHCPLLLEESLKGEIIPRVCNYEICQDLICCPIDPNRLNQLCKSYDDPHYNIREKIDNQLKCTVAKTEESGIFQSKCFDGENDEEKLCDFEECRWSTCCPFKDDTRLHEYGSIYHEFSEIVGDKCHEEKTNTDGVCRFEWQCIQSVYGKYSLCGRDHCSNIRCCPEPNPETLDRSAASCANYKKFVYERIKPLTNLISPMKNDSTWCIKSGSASGGIQVREKEYPQMAALGYEVNNEITWNCGGTLISEFFVLTAAHCLYSSAIGHVKHVRLGVLNVKNSNLACPEEFLVESTYAHPQFKNQSVYNDIALIRLNRKVNFTPFIVPACLPTQQKDQDLSSSFRALGWGQTSTLGMQSDHLLRVTLDYFNNSECNELYKYNKNRKFPDGINEETQICAGSRYTIQDTCPGDSGGPLFAAHDEYYKMQTLIGITSFGKACGYAGSPGVYTKVLPFVKWIEDIVWPKSNANEENVTEILNVTENVEDENTGIYSFDTRGSWDDN